MGGGQPNEVAVENARAHAPQEMAGGVEVDRPGLAGSVDEGVLGVQVGLVDPGAVQAGEQPRQLAEQPLAPGLGLQRLLGRTCAGNLGEVDAPDSVAAVLEAEGLGHAHPALDEVGEKLEFALRAEPVEQSRARRAPTKGLRDHAPLGVQGDLPSGCAAQLGAFRFQGFDHGPHYQGCRPRENRPGWLSSAASPRILIP